MKPRPVALADTDHWASLGLQAVMREFTSPAGCTAPVESCEALVTGNPEWPGTSVVRVPWVLDDADRAALAAGGTLWLSCWGHLPVHNMHVQEVTRG
jgi:hypothetical protein